MRFRFRLPCTLHPARRTPHPASCSSNCSALQHSSRGSQTLALLSLALPVAITFVPYPLMGLTLLSLSPSSSSSFSFSFSPQSLNRQTLPAKCFRRNVPQSCKYKQRSAAQFFENILSFSSGFSPKELHTFLIEQLGNARQSKGRGRGRDWMGVGVAFEISNLI